MQLKTIAAVVIAATILIEGSCGPATPTTTPPPANTPPVSTPPVTTPPATTPPTTTPPVTTPPSTTPPVTTPPFTTPPVTTPPPDVRGPYEVWAQGGNTFNPGILTVPVGTTVVWKNKDSVAHTVVSNTGLFYGTLNVGGNFSYTFTKAGDYEYNCDIHAGMAGAIHVQ